MSKKPHWHEYNPWNDHIVYVPILDLAACALSLENPYNSWTMIDQLAHWTQYGNKLDAYILNSVVLMGGIRYGRAERDYLSPGFSLPKLHSLLQIHTPKPKYKRRTNSSSP
jgi:hypothetical protein